MVGASAPTLETQDKVIARLHNSDRIATGIVEDIRFGKKFLFPEYIAGVAED
jgi:hypothetical protein